MKKRKIIIIISSLLLLLAVAAWIYFKVLLPKNDTYTKDKGKAGIKNMNMDMPDMEMSEYDTAAISDAQLNFLLKPTNEYVLSSVPVTTISTANEAIKVKALGNIMYDTRQIGSVSARIAGRIEKLYVRYRYQAVSKGQKILDLYSPEILTAQQNLLFLLKSDPENTSFITAAKEKLLLLGMSNAQLQQVIKTRKPNFTISIFSPYSGHVHEAEQMGNAGQSSSAAMKDISLLTEELRLKEGMYLEKGQSIFSIYNPGRAWAVLNFFADEQSAITKGSAVRIVPETMPDKAFTAKINFIEPFYRKENKTVTARVYFDNSILKIPIGSQVTATLYGKDFPGYWLAADAVVSLGIDKAVFVKQGTGFKAHKVVTGAANKNSIQILSGLSLQDTVAANAQYLMDSESFIKANE